MTYRARPQPSEQQTDEFDRATLYRHVFGTPDGARVLDDICQRICLLDAFVRFDTELQAARALERKNVGLEIANLVLRPIEQPKPKVNT